MKLFDIDWQDFLWRAVVWDRSAITSREAFLRLKGNAATEATDFGDDLALLLKHRFLVETKEHRCHVHGSCRGFSKAARAMYGRPLFALTDSLDATPYLKDHFTAEERRGLNPGRTAYYGADHNLTRTVCSVSWVRSFLAAEDAADWERQRRNGGHYTPFSFRHSEVTMAAKKLLNHLLTDPQPIPFRQLPDLLPDASVDVIEAVVFGTLRYTLLFGGMDDEWTPRLGLWPTVASRLGRPPASQPKPVEPERQFQAAVALEDLTTLVVAVAGGPLRLRANDGRLFAKVIKDLEPRLLALPEWLPATTAAKDAEGRLTQAVHMAVEMKLAHCKFGSRPSLRIKATGEQWLADAPKGRLRAILAHTAKVSDRHFAMDHAYGRYQKPEPDVPAELKRVYGSLPEGSYVRWDEFLAWHMENSNPYSALAESGKRVRLRSAWYHDDSTPEEMENQWQRDLTEFVGVVLLPVGGLKIGCIGPDDSLCLALTDVGRFFLGQSDDFAYEADHGDEVQLVVQPNFEVAFLSRAPLAEATLARFADRKGTGLGALFKLTKSSVFGAAAAGMTCDQVLDTLRRVSTKELPKNVVREIEGWFGQCRTVTAKTTILIHCPDADTAARVVSAGGKKTELLTETIVAVSDAKAKKTVVQKLKNAGIFLDRGGRKGKGDG
jgi:hypothetical protein